MKYYATKGNVQYTLEDEADIARYKARGFIVSSAETIKIPSVPEKEEIVREVPNVQEEVVVQMLEETKSPKRRRKTTKKVTE